MTLFYVILICFLIVFISSAIIALLGITGKLKVRETFLKPLFKLVILEVAAAVVGFATIGVRFYFRQPLELSEELLINQPTWFWQYSKSGWYTKGNFLRGADHSIRFIGKTYFVRAGEPETLIFIWTSRSPVILDKETGLVSFKATQQILADVTNTKYSQPFPQPGEYQCEVELTLKPALEGAYKFTSPDGTQGEGGMTFIRKG